MPTWDNWDNWRNYGYINHGQAGYSNTVWMSGLAISSLREGSISSTAALAPGMIGEITSFSSLHLLPLGAEWWRTRWERRERAKGGSSRRDSWSNQPGLANKPSCASACNRKQLLEQTLHQATGGKINRDWRYFHLLQARREGRDGAQEKLLPLEESGKQSTLPQRAQNICCRT